MPAISEFGGICCAGRHHRQLFGYKAGWSGVPVFQRVQTRACVCGFWYDPPDWDKARSYEPLMIVLDPETGDGYISRYDVPAGTLLTNEHYWARCSHSNAQMHRLETDVAEDVEGMHTDLANTKSAMSEGGVPAADRRV